MLDLLSEMALSLGYKDLKQTEIDSFYNPQQFVDQNQMHNELMTENLRILRHSKNLAEPYTEEEYNKLYPKEE